MNFLESDEQTPPAGKFASLTLPGESSYLQKRINPQT
jgi:hypothetical protein